MSKLREELVARRDALIEQLQGEWVLEVDFRSINRKASLAALIVMVVTGLFFVLTVVGLSFTQAESVRAENGLFEFDFALLLIAFMLIAGFLVYMCIWAFGLWYRNLNPIQINANQLHWDKRKGFVPERMDLTRVHSAMRYDGAGSSRLVMGLINMLDRKSQTEFVQCAFFSRGEHNTPKFIPAMFKDGHRLVSTIEEIAKINTEISALDESVHSA